MKPADHPEFFIRPPPDGRSRESTIVLDEQGRFLHDGELVRHEGLAGGFAKWVRRHPIDGRYILCNDYDWCYFTVRDTPYFVQAVVRQTDGFLLTLSDEQTELVQPGDVWVDDAGVFRVRVKLGSFEAKFGRQAQLQMGQWLAPEAPLRLCIGERMVPLAQSPPPEAG